MPFDAFLLDRLAREWNVRWRNMEVSSAWSDKSRVILQGWSPASRRNVFVLVAFTPGYARIHETQHRYDLPKATHPLFLRFLPFTIDSVFTQSFDRILWLAVHWTDDWGQETSGYLVIELTGHITNMVIMDSQHNILESLRHVQDKKRNRIIRPGQLYRLPDALPHPCQTHQTRDLSPSVRQLLPDAEAWSLETFCRQYETSALSFYILDHDERRDLWVSPLPGWRAESTDEPDTVLDKIFWNKEQERLRTSLQDQLVAHWRDRVHHLREKLADTELMAQENSDIWKEQGDLWLAYQYNFKNQQETHVPSFSDPARTLTLTLPEGKTPTEMAEHCYRQYKRIKNRRTVSERLTKLLAKELNYAEESLTQAREDHPIDYYRTQLKHLNMPQGKKRQDNLPFRRFVSTGGFEIFVGRNREENQELTMRRARPDDLWFHVKQGSGSHVILFTGKRQANLEDLLDAAHLAAYYSPAKHSSTVAVDYTKRKFVRKKPHAEAGQVLYEREKTLYVTPDDNRLRKLGATHDKLLD
ncbi:MAG: NFACT RNA binding domain-containing protein [Firmicutes bacterium]|nr:NFACT RNA binding domain-containing protein [Bacillota bacterium]MCL5013835.1 NFACT RNA binding domain-containing protein [Bacillota bacterium]